MEPAVRSMNIGRQPPSAWAEAVGRPSAWAEAVGRPSGMGRGGRSAVGHGLCEVSVAKRRLALGCSHGTALFWDRARRTVRSIFGT